METTTPLRFSKFLSQLPTAREHRDAEDSIPIARMAAVVKKELDADGDAQMAQPPHARARLQTALAQGTDGDALNAEQI